MKYPHLIMPMGGAGSRFYKDGYAYPKPLIKIHEKPFFYWAANSITQYVKTSDITFVVLRQHINEFSIETAIHNYYPDANIVILEKILPGPVFTALKGIERIVDDAPVIFNDCDHMFCCSEMNDLLNDGKIEFDAALLTFESNEPQFSYVNYNENGIIVGTVEKKVVSDHAICGAYVFKNAKIYRQMAKEYTQNCPYNECFMSGIYSVMCAHDMRVQDYLLDYHVEFGTPKEYEQAKESPYFTMRTGENN